MILLVTIAVFFAGYYFDKITVSASGYVLSFVCALIGGALYLSLGQVIVGLIKNPETVSSTTRLVYFAFIMIGMFGELGLLGKQIGEAVKWSPYGTVKHIISDSLHPATWDVHSSVALLVTFGYTLIFTVLGINWFKWNSR